MKAKYIKLMLAGSIVLFAQPAFAGPFDRLFGGEEKMAGAASAPSQGIKRLGDSELNCEQIYTEVNQLEAQIEKSQADTTAQSAGAAKKQMGLGVAQSLLGAVPFLGGNSGGGMIAGMVASQAASHAVSSQAHQGAQQTQQAHMDGSTAAARRDYLIDMFEQKRCKVSDLKK